jgi:hypothetical protein
MTPNGSHSSSWSALTPDPSGERVPGELNPSVIVGAAARREIRLI